LYSQRFVLRIGVVLLCSSIKTAVHVSENYRLSFKNQKSIQLQQRRDSGYKYTEIMKKYGTCKKRSKNKIIYIHNYFFIYITKLYICI